VPKNALQKLIMVLSGAFVASALTVVAPAGADPIEIRVTILMDGAPVDGGARLTAYTQNPVTKRWDNAYTSAATDASGQITIPGLIPDSYRFCYTPEWDDTYRRGCFGAAQVLDATTFEVTGSVDLGSVNLTKKDVIDMSGLAIQGKAVVGQRLSVNTEIRLVMVALCPAITPRGSQSPKGRASSSKQGTSDTRLSQPSWLMGRPRWGPSCFPEVARSMSPGQSARWSCRWDFQMRPS